ncbi:HAD hydrolase family protein, partial [Brevibacterium casei]
MLELAQYSYVMKNSQDKTLFDIAYDVAPSNDDQGVLTTIENVVLNLK